MPDNISLLMETRHARDAFVEDEQDAPRVKEAKEIVAAALGKPEPALVPWAMRMAEARDAWANSRRKRA